MVRTWTRSAPWMLGEAPVILLEGIPGGYLLTRVRALAGEKGVAG